MLFLPWGLLVPLIVSGIRTAKRIIISVLLISLIAEAVQYAFRIGVSDIDDVIYNVGGAVIGFYFLGLLKIKRREGC